MKQFLFVIISIFFIGQLFAQSKEVPFTLDDRDRIIKMEERLNSLEDKLSSLRNEMNTRFEAVDKKFDAINSKFDAINSKFDAIDSKFDAINSKLDVLYWGFGIVITLILFLFGYIIFDRRKTIKPLEQEVSIIKYRQDNLGSVIKEFAKKDKSFAEALKKVAF